MSDQPKSNKTSEKQSTAHQSASVKSESSHVRLSNSSSTAKKPQTMSLLSSAGMAFEFAGGVAVLTLIGYGLDQYFDTAPWLLLTGAILGVVVGMGKLIIEAMKMNPSK